MTGMHPLLRCLLSGLPPRHRFSGQIAGRQTDSSAEKDGHAAAGLRPVYASCCPSRPRRCSRSQAFMPTTRIPALLTSPRMKLTAPIVEKCPVRDGHDHHPATLTCAADSLGREERSVLLFCSPPAAGYPGRSICTERRALRAKALNLPSL